MSHRDTYYRIDKHGDGNKHRDEPKSRNHHEGFHAKGCDALNGQGDHLAERILRFTCQSLLAPIVDFLGPKAERWDDATQEEVPLAILGQPPQRDRTHKPEVSAIRNDLGSEAAHNVVVAPCGKALEGGVRVAVVTYPIDDLRAL